MTGNKRTKIILVTLERQGCVIEEKKSGWLVKFPNNTGTMTIHNTPSDHRAELNLRSIAVRAGLKWPFDK